MVKIFSSLPLDSKNAVFKDWDRRWDESVLHALFFGSSEVKFCRESEGCEDLG